MLRTEADEFEPNLPEVRFALSMWGIAELMERAGHAAELKDDILQEASRFAKDVLFPASAAGDRAGCRQDDGKVQMPAEFATAYRSYRSAGWHGIAMPTAYGGQGLPILLASAVTEMFNSANLALTGGLMPAGGAVALFERFGTTLQKATYLPKITSGEWLVTMAMTESQAGSDLGAIRTRAFHDGPRTKLSGQKSLITFGDHELTENIVHLVLARTPNGPAGTKGLSLYVVPKFSPTDGRRNDIACISIEHKMGMSGGPTATLVFGSNGGAEAELLGTENCGLEQMFILMNRARLNVAIFGVASAEGARQAATRYAISRIQGRDKQQRAIPILYYPDVRRMIASMTARTEAARYIAYYTASLLDQASADVQSDDDVLKRLDIMTPIAKSWCTENGFDIASIGVQVHGGLGYMHDTEASRYFREARVHTIYEGTTGIHANDLMFRKIIRDGGASMLNFFFEMQETAQEALSNSELRLAGEGLSDAIRLCGELTQWIVAQEKNDPQRLQANGAHFLMMVGTCVGGWLSVRAALVALRDRDAWPAQMVRKKVRQARFFMQQFLPPALAMSEAIRHGADPVLDVLDDFRTTPTSEEVHP